MARKKSNANESDAPVESSAQVSLGEITSEGGPGEGEDKAVQAKKPVEEKEVPKQDAEKISAEKPVASKDVPRKYHKFL